MKAFSFYLSRLMLASAWLSLPLTSLASGWSAFPCPLVATAPLHKSFFILQCEGQKALGGGDFLAASKKFEEAASLQLYEEPNFEILLDAARASCLASDRQRGRALLNEFDESLRIYSGVVSCRSRAIGVQRLAQKRMCGEMFADGYKQQAQRKAVVDHARALTKMSKHVALSCG